jgi:hypothetical protein
MKTACAELIYFEIHLHHTCAQKTWFPNLIKNSQKNPIIFRWKIISNRAIEQFYRRASTKTVSATAVTIFAPSETPSAPRNYWEWIFIFCNAQFLAQQTKWANSICCWSVGSAVLWKYSKGILWVFFWILFGNTVESGSVYLDLSMIWCGGPRKGIIFQSLVPKITPKIDAICGNLTFKFLQDW